MNRPLAVSLLMTLALAGSACNSHPVDEPICGEHGENVRLPTERELCVYRWPIVIETGFSCPAERPDRFELEPHFATCSNFGDPIRIERDFLIDRYGVPGRPWAIYDPVAAPETDELDLLWVIDNSGSMCQEQAQLRDNFTRFVSGLADQNLDFQLAVTTTQMNPDYALEPLAQPGVIQSRPQPVPGFDRSCHTAVDEMGQPIAGDYSPILQSIEVAVGCMAEPDLRLIGPTNQEIECAMYNSPAGCTIPRLGCGGPTPCTPESLFPAPDSYRQIPKVLHSTDYMVDGALDIEALSADFACASLVGTRGYGIEKGLSAAVAAVSADKTAGPNAGFLRDEARFAVMFISDENDCSHDGTLREDSACGGDVCEYWNREDLLGGPLIPVAELKSELLGNLTVSKGRPVSEAEVFVGSIHGQGKRYTGAQPTDAECAAANYTGIEPTCATTLGIAYSGDRYDRFLAQFTNAFPRPNPDGTTIGWLCRGDFSPAIAALGQWLGTATSP